MFSSSKVSVWLRGEEMKPRKEVHFLRAKTVQRRRVHSCHTRVNSMECRARIPGIRCIAFQKSNLPRSSSSLVNNRFALEVAMRSRFGESSTPYRQRDRGTGKSKVESSVVIPKHRLSICQASKHSCFVSSLRSSREYRERGWSKNI